MRCIQCGTHICCNCCARLELANPYAHFNQPGNDCYQQLWNVAEVDDGVVQPDEERGHEEVVEEMAGDLKNLRLIWRVKEECILWCIFPQSLVIFLNLHGSGLVLFLSNPLAPPSI